MRLNIVAGMFGMVWLSAAIGMPLPLFMQSIRASGFELGLLSAAWQIAMLAQIPSAFFVERLPRRKLFWAVVSIPHRCLWAAPAVVPLLFPGRMELWPWAVIASLGLASMLGQGGTAPWQSWMADLLPPSRAGRFWGVRQGLMSLGMAVSALAFGFILDATGSEGEVMRGFQIVFLLAAVFGVTDIVIHCWVAEPTPVRSVPGRSPIDRLLWPFRERDFLLLTLAMGVWTAGQAMLGYTMGLPGFFGMVYLKESCGATYAQASWLFIAAAVGGVIITPRIGHWIDLYGGRKVMLALTGCGPLCMAAWWFANGRLVTLPWAGSAAFPQAVLLMCAVSVLAGGIYIGSYICQLRLTQALTGSAGRTVAMGVHWSLVGLIGSGGAMFAGWLKDYWTVGKTVAGVEVSYFQILVLCHAALAWGIAWPLLRMIRR